MAVKRWLNYRAQTHDQIRHLSERKKEAEATRYNRGIREVSLNIGDLVMLFQKDTGKLELLVQLNGRKIRGSFHGDHLKKFVPRTGHLTGSSTPTFPTTQTIRKPRRPRSKKP